MKHTFRTSNFWQRLLHKQQSFSKTTISQLFSQDVNRSKNFSYSIEDIGLKVDFSKQHIDLETLTTLCNAAKHCELSDKITDLFKGAKINITQQQDVWHIGLRDINPTIKIANVLQQISDFTEHLYKSNYQNILYIGIGGSYLGPLMVSKGLEQYTHNLAKNLNIHFIANRDTTTINNILEKLNPETTIAIISSKSFTTKETLSNARIIMDWFTKQGTFNDYIKQIFAITCNINKAIDFGIKKSNIFPFWDFVGGRYSVWSAVGLPIAIKIGMKNFRKFLLGAYIVDQHFKFTDFSNNIPVLMALIGIWNINFMKYRSLAIMPYLDALEHLPSYLQQLEMESNGKTVDLKNNFIDYDTAPVIWGGVGCNGQHSYMQMLHQGSQIVPMDFFASTKDKFLLANCLAQSKALMEGTSFNGAEDLESFKVCRGNRPSSTIFFSELTPEIVGALIALYEHKVFVQGVMWNINSFDQWGVELGKNLADQILLQLNSETFTKEQV